MTNFEKWKNEITNIRFAVVNGKPTNCRGISCTNCLFKEWDSCADARLEWLKAEYLGSEVDWTKVKVDTPILVSDDGKGWRKRYFARYENNVVYAWEGGTTSWSVFINSDVTCWNYAKLARENDGE